MTFEELDRDPKSRSWHPPAMPTLPRLAQSIETKHIFWMVDEEGDTYRATWDKDGHVVRVED